MSKRARGTEHGRGWAALLLLLALSSLLRGFAYTTEDDLIAVTNEAGGKTCFVRDANGAITAETGFDGARRTYKRDKAGRVTEVTLPSKKKTQLSYDAMGRVEKTTYADGTTVEWEYRPDGALAAATNEAGAVTFERDAIGRLLREARGEYHVTSRYAPDGGRETLQSTLGAKAHTFFDPLGEVQALSFGEGTVQSAPTELAIERDAMGNEVRRTLPGGVAIAWERDKAGRPTHRHSLKAQPGFDVLSETEHLAYQWRGNDQLAAILDSDTGPRWYDHDRRGRLVRERGNDWASVRAMDPVGNVYHASDGSDRKFGAGGKLEQDRDGTRYAYDPDGNLVEKVTPEGTWKYAWNGAGQLKEVERPDGLRVAHQYDAFARRTSKRSYRLAEDGTEQVERETAFVWDGNVVLHELDSEQGLTTWHWEPGTFTPVAKERGGKRWTIASDHLGTPREMFDDAGQLAWKMQLDVWGVASYEEGDAEDCPWRWPGQYEDAETGEYYNRNRFYDPKRGAYTQQDPLGLEGGFGQYTYVEDPSAWIDPLGLTKKCGHQQEKPIIVGENMNRVQRYAKATGAHAYDPWPNEPFDFDLGMRRNERWIRDQIRSGRKIIGIGPDFARRSATGKRSPFYEMERRNIGKLEPENYEKVVNPRRSPS